MTNDHDDDLREELRRRAASVTPRGTYADLETKLAAAAHGPSRWQRPLLLSVAAVLALLLGAGVVALATRGGDDEQRVAGTGDTTIPTVTTTAPVTSLVPPPSTPSTSPPSTSEPDVAVTTTTSATTTTTTTTPPSQPVTGDSRVTLYGIDALKLPLSKTQVRAVTGQALTGPSGDYPGSSCDFTNFVNGPKGLAFMTEGDRLVRVDVAGDSTIRTVSGIGIGSTEAEVRATYPSAKVETGTYSGLEVTVTDPDAPGYKVILQLDSGIVTAYRSGVAEYVDYVEGCA